MQVQRIQLNNTNFGYNAKLNEQLVKKLKMGKKNRPFMDTMLELNTICNSTENRLRVAEKLGNEDMVLNLSNALVALKDYLSEEIEYYFPKLNFCKKEADSYIKEIVENNITDEEHWLNEMVEHLKMNQAANEFTSKELDPNELPDDIKERLDESAEAMVTKDKHAANGKDLVREYKPTEESKLGFAALGGMQELKKTLNDRIVGMLKNPEQAKLDEIEYGKKVPKGILLYGPPGCGKTTIVEHLSTEAGVPLLELETEKIGSAYIHEMSENIGAAFDYAESIATKDKPVLMFVDDADAMFTSRTRANDKHDVEEMATFLNRIQKAGNNNVVVVAATNEFDLLDKAIKSRFEEQIYVGLPDKEARKSVLKMFMNKRTKGKALAANDAAIDSIAEKLDKFPIRDIKMISDKASLEALNDGRRDIEARDFDKIIAESQNRKIKEEQYKPSAERTPIGFGPSLKTKVH